MKNFVKRFFAQAEEGMEAMQVVVIAAIAAVVLGGGYSIYQYIIYPRTQQVVENVTHNTTQQEVTSAPNAGTGQGGQGGQGGQNGKGGANNGGNNNSNNISAGYHNDHVNVSGNFSW